METTNLELANKSCNFNEGKKEHFNRGGLGSNQGTYNAFEDVNFLIKLTKLIKLAMRGC